MAQETRNRTGMPPQYDSKAAEARWYEEWVRRGYFHPTPSEREPFCISMPPPNVTGRLHVGHALTMTLQDTLTRRARMQGYETLWLPGMDHAGIATQVVVERELRKEGIDRREIGRERFVERVWEWRESYGGQILEQLKVLGASCDWDRQRFTMDEGLSKAVRVAFVRMYEDGLIYRGERIINWCPTDQTALSDSELEHEEVAGELVTFRYPLADGSGHISVATTRIETMLGDTGVAVHPEDPRYRDVIGKTVRHPFTGNELPVVTDEAVDPEFATGAVKVTPAHDPTDFAIAERTGLPRLNILNPDGTISDAGPEEFRGLDRYEARKRVLDGLREMDLVEAEERPYPHIVGHCYRCGSEIEPWLSGKQWFVAVDRLKGPARDAVTDGRITFWPDRWISPYAEWLDNLRDWNISRQLWWGHRIPVWYCQNGHEFASIEDPGACPECGSSELEQDPDVLDTWFSSQLWPFSTLGWPEETEDLRFFYPTTVLVTGYEILYLWVARMIMSGLYLAGDVPFRGVVIHGLVRDAQGRKMSKSLGNVIDPLDMIERYGADALRFALVRMAGPDQQNYPLSQDGIEDGRNFANKIWNAARRVLLDYQGAEPQLPEPSTLTVTERWLLSRHQRCVSEVNAAFDTYRFDDAANAIRRFVWSEFADWGLELEKGALQTGGEEGARAASVLAWIMERTLRLLHPVMPFVTEDVWQRLGSGDSIVVAPWPEGHPDHADPEAEALLETVMSLVGQVRTMRALIGGHEGSRLTVDEGYRNLLEPLREPVERLTGDSLAFGSTEEDADGSRSLRLSGLRAAISVPGDFDSEPALKQRRKQLSEIEAKLEGSERKLASGPFRERADPAAVQKEKRKAGDLRGRAEDLREQIRVLESL